MGILVQFVILVSLDKTLFFSRTQVPNDAFNIIIFSIPFFFLIVIAHAIQNSKSKLEYIFSVLLFMVSPIVFYLLKKVLFNMEVVLAWRTGGVLIIAYNLLRKKKKKSATTSKLNFFQSFLIIIIGLVFCTWIYRSVSFKSFMGWYIIENNNPLLIQYFNDAYIILENWEIRKNNDTIILKKGRPGLRREMGSGWQYIIWESFISEDEMRPK